jgi:GMP synthase-like glutamine amidotransferase
MRVLAFRHVPFEDAGMIATVLEGHGIFVEYADLYLPGSTPPETAAFDGLVFMGGPMSVNDNLPYLQWEMRTIADAIERGQPVLGICLGAQLIAKAMGAHVYRNPEKEIGFFEVRFAEEAQDDPLFSGLTSETVFHWHGETFHLPAGAVLLGSSARCRNQAFRIGERTYAMQFHLEVTPAMIADWCTQDENSEDVQQLDSTIDAFHNSEVLRGLAEKVFSRWYQLLIASRGAPPPGDKDVASRLHS